MEVPIAIARGANGKKLYRFESLNCDLNFIEAQGVAGKFDLVAAASSALQIGGEVLFRVDLVSPSLRDEAVRLSAELARVRTGEPLETVGAPRCIVAAEVATTAR